MRLKAGEQRFVRLPEGEPVWTRIKGGVEPGTTLYSIHQRRGWRRGELTTDKDCGACMPEIWDESATSCTGTISVYWPATDLKEVV